jgi:malate permease and related proteins
MVVINAVQSVFSIVIMIIIGYVLMKKGWFDAKSQELLSKLVTNVSLPPLMIYTLLTHFDRESLIKSGSGLIIPFVSIGFCYVLGTLLSRFIKVEYERRGLYSSMFFASNTIFIGLPVNLALFGEKSVPYVLLYYVANTVFFWTIGVHDIRKYAEGKNDKILSLNTFKIIFSPPLLGFIVGIILIFLNIHLPQFLMDTCKYLGNLTTPLSMMFVGITMFTVNLKKIKMTLEMFTLMAGRFIISPLVVFLLALLIPAPMLMKKVFIIQAAMPVITQAAIISKAYNSDDKYAAVMVTVSTIISLLFIPLYMLIFSYIK